VVVLFQRGQRKSPAVSRAAGLWKIRAFFRPYDPPVTATQLNGSMQHTRVAALAAAWVIEA